MTNIQNPDRRVLAVIPCLNEEQNLERLVLDLTAANIDLPLQIVIADGGSRDGTIRVAQNLAAKFSNVRVMNNPKRIQSAGINLAVAAFGGSAEFLIRIDAHAEYSSDYCRVLIEEAERTHASSVVVAMKTAGRGWFQRAVAEAQNSKLGNGGAAHRIVGKAGMWTEHGHHALMRVEAFLSVGGYDETFAHNEDAELDIRLRKAGFEIWLTGRTSLTYYPRPSPAGLFRQYVNYGAGRARTFLKHHERPKPRQLVPAAVLPACLVALATPFTRAAALPLTIWAATCLAYGAVLAFKAKSIGAAASGVAAMIMHMGWSFGFWKVMFSIFWDRTPRNLLSVTHHGER
jgi:succinoglycan biosynthesis protein ExoA